VVGGGERVEERGWGAPRLGVHSIRVVHVSGSFVCRTCKVLGFLQGTGTITCNYHPTVRCYFGRTRVNKCVADPAGTTHDYGASFRITTPLIVWWGIGHVPDVEAKESAVKLDRA